MEELLNIGAKQEEAVVVFDDETDYVFRIQGQRPRAFYSYQRRRMTDLIRGLRNNKIPFTIERRKVL